MSIVLDDARAQKEESERGAKARREEQLTDVEKLTSIVWPLRTRRVTYLSIRFPDENTRSNLLLKRTLSRCGCMMTPDRMHNLTVSRVD